MAIPIDLKKVDAIFDESNIGITIDDMLFPDPDMYILEELTIPEIHVLRGKVIETVIWCFNHKLEKMRS